MDELVSVAEAADRLGKTPQTIRNWIDRGWLVAKAPPSGVGIMVSVASIEAAMQPVLPKAAGHE